MKSFVPPAVEHDRGRSRRRRARRGAAARASAGRSASRRAPAAADGGWGLRAERLYAVEPVGRRDDDAVRPKARDRSSADRDGKRRDPGDSLLVQDGVVQGAIGPAVGVLPRSGRRDGGADPRGTLRGGPRPADRSASSRRRPARNPSTPTLIPSTGVLDGAARATDRRVPSPPTTNTRSTSRAIRARATPSTRPRSAAVCDVEDDLEAAPPERAFERDGEPPRSDDRLGDEPDPSELVSSRRARHARKF